MYVFQRHISFKIEKKTRKLIIKYNLVETSTITQNSGISQFVGINKSSDIKANYLTQIHNNIHIILHHNYQ
jgi:hypothetical protein